MHTVIGTAANVNDVTQAAGLLHGEELVPFADAGDQGMAKRDELKDSKTPWHVSLRPGKRPTKTEKPSSVAAQGLLLCLMDRTPPAQHAGRHGHGPTWAP